MRVLMFGWEFPPYVSGGLGVACEGLVRGLLELETEVALVLPDRPFASGMPGLSVIPARLSPASRRAAGPPRTRRAVRLWLSRVRTLLAPYVTEEGYRSERAIVEELDPGEGSVYGPDLHQEVLRYADAAARIAARESFDLIHAHDWLTFLAGIQAQRASGKPLLVHVHATEYDRAGGGENRFVTAVERAGLSAADRVVAVSGYTAGILATRYGVPAERLRVVHNAIDAREPFARWTLEEGDPLVLFAGRITRQKGPDYFVDAAARVAAEMPNVKFAVAGVGDRLREMIDRVTKHGLDDRFLFTGFLPTSDLDRLYARADVYVMPSASEPFGLTALEALQQGTPVILSKSAGVSEVVKNVLRVRFGDVEDLASKILAVLLFPPLKHALSARGRAEVRRLSWRESAWRCIAVYRELVGEWATAR
ncbi:MAG: glycosyltransferase family 4 protein [Thermoanaerobaculia bacterium]